MVIESTIRIERAMDLESTKVRERARRQESTTPQERARGIESASAFERAIHAESTKLQERASCLERTKTKERAKKLESTITAERAKFAESTTQREPAKPRESAKYAERAKIVESTMMAKRPYIPRDTKIAACLLELFELRGDGIPFRQAQQMSAAEICSLVHWDHAVLHAWGGSIHPTNITPRLILAHREKTAKRDVPAIVKSRVITRAHARHQETMQHIDVRGERSDGQSSRPKSKRKWPHRQFPKQQRGFR